MIKGNEFHGTHTFVGWDMGGPEGDYTMYTVTQCRGDGQLVVIYSGPDGVYADALAKQLCDNQRRRRPMLFVIEGGLQST